MGDVHYLFGTAPDSSVSAMVIIRRARRALAAYLPPNYDVTPTECVVQVREILEASIGKLPSNAAEMSAECIVFEARRAIWRPRSDWARVGDLLDILDSAAARRFADPRLPELRHFGC